MNNYHREDNEIHIPAIIYIEKAALQYSNHG